MRYLRCFFYFESLPGYSRPQQWAPVIMHNAKSNKPRQFSPYITFAICSTPVYFWAASSGFSGAEWTNDKLQSFSASKSPQSSQSGSNPLQQPGDKKFQRSLQECRLHALICRLICPKGSRSRPTRSQGAKGWAYRLFGIQRLGLEGPRGKRLGLQGSRVS